MSKKFMCRHCGRIFEKEEISTPITNDKGERIGDWVWMMYRCPGCKRGRDDWYISQICWKYNWLDAVRYQRNIKGAEE